MAQRDTCGRMMQVAPSHTLHDITYSATERSGGHVVETVRISKRRRVETARFVAAHASRQAASTQRTEFGKYVDARQLDICRAARYAQLAAIYCLP